MVEDCTGNEAKTQSNMKGQRTAMACLESQEESNTLSLTEPLAASFQEMSVGRPFVHDIITLFQENFFTK